MSFIPKQDKTPKTRINVHLRQDVAEQAKPYAGYLDSDLDHLVEQLFLKAFKADKEFQKTAAHASAEPTPVPLPERTGKPTKKPETPGEGGLKMAEERQIGPGERAAVEAGKEAYGEAIRTAEQRVRQLAEMTPEISTERKREPASTLFWTLPGASEAASPEPKSERSQERRRQQERGGLGFSL